ncbi:TauD/TfdA family dioxygenase [Chromobacterium sp. ASV23]|uniref:TauD/TfdA family dioxygenase n=1 Tax=Chromobacterium sp. ASV23 TaxID=2795110 RepID=UPI0018ECBC50|nr:TauD/TfdA family dioxygenase [Chromobacterium sp. ASV23]
MEHAADQALRFQHALGHARVACRPLSPWRMPLLITPLDETLRSNAAAFADWYRNRLPVLDQALLAFGSVLLRGFALRDTADFQAIAQLYPEHAFGYIGGATPRRNIDGKVYESTRIPASLKIGLHQEKAYMAQYPHKLAFFCKQPSESGGETIICDMRAVTRRLPPALIERFRQSGIQYLRNFRRPSQDGELKNSTMREYHRPWDDVFQSDDPARVEQLCRETNLSFRWLDDGSLTVSHTGGATARHPGTGEDIWFNQLSTQHNNARSMGAAGYEYIRLLYRDRPARPYEVRLGDGTPITLDEIAPIYDALDAEEIAFPWQRGDLLLLDNIAVAHGRNPFKGSRDIQVALFD